MKVNLGTETKIETEFVEFTIAIDPEQKCVHIWVKEPFGIEVECNHIRLIANRTPEIPQA